jgi:hypothetical protein
LTDSVVVVLLDLRVQGWARICGHRERIASASAICGAPAPEKPSGSLLTDGLSDAVQHLLSA